MTLSRVYVGFSSTDLNYYNLMKAWKKSDNTDFNFAECGLRNEIDSENENYIKRVCRNHLKNAGTFIQLIGENTRYKYKYVRWEAEVALEKGCRIIGVNLNGERSYDADRCSPILRDKGVMFVPFRSKIIQYALDYGEKKPDGNWHYKDSVYDELGLND